MSVRVFITGASAYAGYYCALRLAEAGHQVAGLVRSSDQPRLNLLRTHEVTLIRGDLSQPDSYRAELEASDVVIHAMLDRRKPLDVDRAFFAALQALPARASKRRFIYTTGCSIFGKVPVAVMDESVEPNPSHPLAFRRMLEKEALALANFGTVVLRPGFMFGNDGFNSIASDWFEMAEKGEAIYRGDREKGWSWIHIDDLAEAYRLVVEAKDSGVAGEVFHLADDHRPRCAEVMRACLDAAGHKGDIRFEPLTKEDFVAAWFDQNEFITSAKAHDRLGWRVRHAGIVESAAVAYRAWKAARA